MSTNKLSTTREVYAQISQTLDALRRCESDQANESQRAHAPTHRDAIKAIVETYCPSGSGFDLGTSLDFDASKPDRLVFETDYHHMNDAGMYDGWSDHTVIVTPSLAFGFEIRVTGRDRNDIKAHIGETFQCLI